MPMTKVYEPGMRITFDPGAKTALVAFRGRLTTLPGRYADQNAAVQAGEDYCRHRGWADRPAATHSLLRPRPMFHFS